MKKDIQDIQGKYSLTEVAKENPSKNYMSNWMIKNVYSLIKHFIQTSPRGLGLF